MVPVIDLVIRAHKPDTRMIFVTFCCIAVVPLAVEFYEQPEMDLAIKLRITVNPHILDPGNIEEHFAAGKIDVTVTATLCKSPVCSMFIIACTREESER